MLEERSMSVNTQVAPSGIKNSTVGAPSFHPK